MKMFMHLALVGVLTLCGMALNAQDSEEGLQPNSSWNFEKPYQESLYDTQYGGDEFVPGLPISGGFAPEPPTLGEVISLNVSIVVAPIIDHIFNAVKYGMVKDSEFNWESCVVGYELHLEKIYNSVSLEHCEAIKHQIDRALLANERLEHATYFQKMIGFLFNPIVLLLIFGFTYVYIDKIHNFQKFLQDFLKKNIPSLSASTQFQLGLAQEVLRTRTSLFGNSIKSFQASAGNGSAEAQNKIGLSFKSGKGVLQDFPEAIKWFRLAASQGLPQAQFNLAKMYAEGQGGPKDLKEAFNLFVLAAKSGMPEAQFELATMFVDGIGTSPDPVRAHMWYNIASANGFENASTLRENLAAKMTSDDISKAQAMASECMTSKYEHCGV